MTFAFGLGFGHNPGMAKAHPKATRPSKVESALKPTPPDTEDLRVQVARRIIAAREAKGYTQTQMADQLQVDQSNWSKVESAKRLPSRKQELALRSRLGITHDYIYYGTLDGLEIVVQRGICARLPELASTPNGKVSRKDTDQA